MVLFTVASGDPCVGPPSEGSIMKRLFASAFLLIGAWVLPGSEPPL